MKDGSTKKSETKTRDDIKSLEKKNIKNDINKESSLENQDITEKKFNNNLYDLDLEEYPNYFEKILGQTDWIKQSDNINILKNVFENKFQLILEKKKSEFINSGGNEIDFYYTPTYKKEFYDLFKNYKNKKNQYFKELLNKQKINLIRKKEIIEEIKRLIDKSQHNSNTYKNFKVLQEAFHKIGQVPRNENNNIWQTYKFHVERFYDLLHLNRELRDVDYRNNYNEKIKIIEKAEKLIEIENIHIAIRELNNLHRLWKVELGPVARDKRESLWQRFQKATKKIHDKKNIYNKNIDSIKLENYEKKVELVNQIKKISENKINKHNEWQNSINQVEELKRKFINVGNVPKEKNKELWNSFRDATRFFNKEKNKFYKNFKILEKKSIEFKEMLIKEMEDILNKDDWKSHIDRVKEIQNEWKNSGRVSKKYSEKLWSDFKLNTNNYFDKLKNKKKILNDNERKIIDEQKKFIEDLRSEKIPLTPKKFESFIIDKSLIWNNIRYNDLGNQEKFVLNFFNEKWNEISIPKNKLELKKYETKLHFIKSDQKQTNNEHNLLKKKIEDISSELNQLENNLDFFSESSTSNPLLIEVNNKINELSTKKMIVETKIKQLKSILNQTLKDETEK